MAALCRDVPKTPCAHPSENLVRWVRVVFGPARRPRAYAAGSRCYGRLLRSLQQQWQPRPSLRTRPVPARPKPEFDPKVAAWRRAVIGSLSSVRDPRHAANASMMSCPAFDNSSGRPPTLELFRVDFLSLGSTRFHLHDQRYHFILGINAQSNNVSRTRSPTNPALLQHCLHAGVLLPTLQRNQSFIHRYVYCG